MLHEFHVEKFDRHNEVKKLYEISKTDWQNDFAIPNEYYAYGDKFLRCSLIQNYLRPHFQLDNGWTSLNWAADDR